MTLVPPNIPPMSPPFLGGTTHVYFKMDKPAIMTEEYATQPSDVLIAQSNNTWRGRFINDRWISTGTLDSGSDAWSINANDTVESERIYVDTPNVTAARLISVDSTASGSLLVEFSANDGVNYTQISPATGTFTDIPIAEQGNQAKVRITDQSGSQQKLTEIKIQYEVDN